MKRLMSLLLSMVLLVTLVPQIAIAEEERNNGAFTYKLKGNGTAVITGYDWENNQGKDIYIPRMIDGYTVTEIGEKAFARLTYDNNEVITPTFQVTTGTLSIPDTVLYIGEKAFMNIYFEKDTITIPASVEYIGAGAFSNCGCKQFVVDQKNNVYATIDGVLYNKKKKELVAYPARFSVSGNAKDERFYITIPEGIVGIGDYALFGLGDVTHAWGISYRLPSTLEYIGDYAFAYNYGFSVDRTVSYNGYTTSKERGIYLPDSLATIGEGAFYNICSSNRRKKLIFADLSNTQITEIPALAFWGVSLSGDIFVFPNALISIGPKAFENARITNQLNYAPNLPAALTHIGENAFANAYLGKGIIFPTDSCLISIGDGAFQGSSFEQLHFDGEISLPSKLESIGEKAFWDIDYLKWIVIPSSVEKIGKDMCSSYTTSLSVKSGSYAALWASENGYNTNQSGTEDTSWLN